tara:strand:- start:172 stop:594 length:423 start_codon:yes stop_codon:yes gene_type:complete
MMSQHNTQPNTVLTEDSTNGVMRRISLSNNFAMDPIGQRICVNAINGQRLYCQLTGAPIVQNSAESQQLWSVMDSTAHDGSKDPVKLYYNTPEQYERHRGIKLPLDLKELWRQKQSNLGYSQFGTGGVESISKREVTIVK